MEVLSAAQWNVTWYLIPLAVIVSLVYSASRYELPSRILRHAAGCCTKILVFMTVILVLLWWLSSGL